MKPTPFNPLRYAMIAAVILKIAALIVVILATPYLPRNFSPVIIGILLVTIIVQSRLLFRRKPQKAAGKKH
jgi:hypothetical protein